MPFREERGGRAFEGLRSKEPQRATAVSEITMLAMVLDCMLPEGARDRFIGGLAAELAFSRLCGIWKVTRTQSALPISGGRRTAGRGQVAR